MSLLLETNENLHPCEEIENYLCHLNQKNQKQTLVNDLVEKFHIDNILKSLINLYESSKNSLYLSLVFFLPNNYLSKMVEEDNYLMRLIRYGYFYRKAESLSSLSFYEDNINDNAVKNIKLLTDWLITQQPLIMDNVLINFGHNDEPKMFDLINHEIIYNYEHFKKHEHIVLEYFQELYEQKCKKIVSNGFIHAEWAFTRTVDEETWNTLLQEVQELYQQSTPIEKIPYKLKNSMVTFYSLKKRLVEFYYIKDMPYPQEVLENPSRLRSHLKSLVYWHFSKKFKYVKLSFPNTDLIISGKSKVFVNNLILKHFPYVNKNLLLGILNFSESLSSIREAYPLEYVQLELNNSNTYEALRVLDFNCFSQLYSEILKLRKETDKCESTIFTFRFLNQEMNYDCYSRFYYNLLIRINKQKNTYLLTKKAINISCTKGFHFIMKITLMADYLYNHLEYNQYSVIRTMISHLIKENKDIEEIVIQVENYVKNTVDLLQNLDPSFFDDSDLEHIEF